MSWRTSLAGIPAGLAFLLSALSQPGPWTWPRVFLALAGALVAVLSAFAGDHAADPPALPARTADPPEPDAVPPERVVLPSLADAVKATREQSKGEP